MNILILIIIAILSSFFTLFLHCCLIIAKESDKYCNGNQDNGKKDEK